MSKRKSDDDEVRTPRDLIQDGKFPEDALLRRNGYRIAHRAPKEEPVWLSPSGDLVAQSKALKSLPKKELELLL